MGQALGGSEATKKLKRAQLPHASNKRGNDQCRCWGPNATIQLLGRLIEAIQQEKGARRLIEERRSAGERSTKRTHQQRPKRFFFPPFFSRRPSSSASATDKRRASRDRKPTQRREGHGQSNVREKRSSNDGLGLGVLQRERPPSTHNKTMLPGSWDSNQETSVGSTTDGPHAEIRAVPFLFWGACNNTAAVCVLFVRSSVCS